MTTPSEIKVANVTSRGRGSVGKNAITPKYVKSIANEDMTILDFGAGKTASHTMSLREDGLNVTAYEFGDNDSELHNSGALHCQYDLVFASNVINVQSSLNMLFETLDQLFLVSTNVIFNYPASPRKGIMQDMKADTLIRTVEQRFDAKVKRVGGTKQAPLLHFHLK